MIPEERLALTQALDKEAIHLVPNERHLVELQIDVAREADPARRSVLKQDFDAAAMKEKEIRWGRIGDAMQVAQMEGLLKSPEERTLTNQPVSPVPLKPAAPLPLTDAEMAVAQLLQQPNSPGRQDSLLKAAALGDHKIRWGRVGDFLADKPPFSAKQQTAA